MAWIQIKFQTTADLSQALADALTEQGAVSVTLQDAADQPLYEPPPGATPLWAETEVIGLFAADCNMDAVIQAIKAEWKGTNLPAWRIEALEDKDWVRAWMDSFKPMRFGARLWICPSWQDPVDPQAVNVSLDPGLAFGTGTHPTTALCMEWLDSHELSGKTGIDYGCGSGILGVAALLLGASQLRAVDNDPQALTATQANADKNHVAHKISIYQPDQLPIEPVDFLLANILAGPLMELAPRLASLVKPGGEIVLSGLLNEQTTVLGDVYSRWFDMMPPANRDDWARLSGQRRPGAD